MAAKDDDGERGFTLGDAGEGADSRRDEAASKGIPKIDFSTFVISLGTSAMYHMGVVDSRDGSAAPAKNLPLARQTIDTLEMLAEKTRGNLGAQEAKLMETLLFELRMRFVEAEK